MKSRSDPQAAIRSELGELRVQIIRSISEGIPSNIADGLGIYQRLLESLLSRFNDLERAVGRRPQYSLLASADTSGQALEWLLSDYEDFLAQAIRTKDSAVVDSLNRGMFGVLVSCLNMGETGASLRFYNLLAASWLQSKEWANETEWKSIRFSILEILRSVGMLTFSVPGITSVLDDRIVFAAQAARTLGVLLYYSIDKEDQDDLASVSATFWRIFRSPEIGNLENLGEPEIDQRIAYDRICDVAEGVAFGVSGWLLSQWKASTIPIEVFQQMWATVEQIQDRGWRAVTRVLDHDFDIFMGWAFWGVDVRADGSRAGHRWESSIREAVLLWAIRTYAWTTDPTLEPIGNEAAQLRDTQAIVSDMLRLLSDIESNSLWMQTFSLQRDSIAGTRSALEELGAECTLNLRRDLIDRPLDPSRLTKFFQAAQTAFVAESSVMSLFLGEQLNSPIPASADLPLEWYFIGPFTNQTKEYFVPTEVFADERNLATTYVRSLKASESQFLLSKLDEVLDHVTAPVGSLETTLRKAISDQSEGDRRPHVIVFGSYLLASEIEKMDRSASIRVGIGEAGTLFGSRLFFESQFGHDRIAVVDPSECGRVNWRAVEVDGYTTMLDLVPDGHWNSRLFVGVREIDASVARELVLDDPESWTVEGLTDSANVDRLRQQVLVRVQELVAWETLGSGGVVISVVESTG